MAVEWDLKKKLLAATVGNLLVGTLLTVIVIISLLLTSFPKWIESTEDAMIGAETDNLGRLSLEKSEFADVHFARVIGDLKASCIHQEDVIRGKVPRTESLTRYSTVEDPTVSPVVPGWDPVNEASTEVSGWYQCRSDGNRAGTCQVVADESDVSAAHLSDTDPMELYYRGLWTADFPFTFGGFWAVTFEDDGFTRLFPYLFVNEAGDANSFINNDIVCETEPGKPTKTGYDGRCRVWYDIAYKKATSSGRPDPRLTAPYLFAGTTELGVTSSFALFDFTGSSEPIGQELEPPVGTDPIGVCMLDFSMGDVGLSVTDSLSDEGYGYLIPKAGGKAVAHPKQDWGKPDETATITELEFGSTTSEEATYFRDNILNKMEAGESGVATFEKNGETWHIAYQDVPSSGYSLGLVMPEEDIREPFNKARSRIDATIGIQVTIIVAVLVALAGVLVLYARKVTESITKPVGLLVSLVKRINTQNFEGDDLVSIQLVTDRKYLSRELAALDKIFRQMYLAVKVGQASFVSGDMQRAEATFMDAMALFARLGHIRGLGVCHTNLGAVYAMRQSYTQSISSYQAAIQNAEEMIENFSVNNDINIPSKGKNPPAPSGNAYFPGESDTEVARSTSEKSHPEQQRSIMTTLAMRQLNLAKCLTERARYSLRTHWPQRFATDRDQPEEIDTAADAPVKIPQALSDLQEAASLSKESIKTLAKFSSTSYLIDVRCDVVNLLALYAEVVGICEQTGEARASIRSTHAISMAESELMNLMKNIQEAGEDSEESEEFCDQRLRAYAAQANLLMAKGDDRAALNAFHFALTSSPTVALSHLHNAAQQFKVVLKRKGEHVAANMLMEQLPASKAASPKDFIILLDASGSMSGGLIKRAVDNMVQLYDEHISEKDRLAVYTFSTTVIQKLQMTLKGNGNEAAHIRRILKGMLSTGGLTACYDSIWKALDDFEREGETRRDRIIVCLTDGEDNMSRNSSLKVIERFKHNPNAQKVMLIIIAVGRLQTANILSDMCKASKDGVLVEAKNGLQDLDEAFEKVSKIIKGVSFRLEAL
eukprot:gb/GECG01010318.1/.p1 GENE.gb/GECG01010318.1/~~gb/GECG01010318.1/.p1  ORF type:complete len:1053 (+),score=144.56 gb/GECG01010318.1/:1-3159(+)